MSARAVVLVVLVASLLCACGGSSKSVPTATPEPSQMPVSTSEATATTAADTPFAPVVEVLTPPPDIDTSDWLTYRDEANGFELKYPPDATVKRDSEVASWWAIEGVGTQIVMPIAVQTSLGGKYLFLTSPNVQEGCSPKEASRPMVLVHSPNVDFRMGDGSGALLSHWLELKDYFASRESTCIRLQAVLEGVNAGVAHLPTPQAEDMSEIVLLAMVATFRWLD